MLFKIEGQKSTILCSSLISGNLRPHVGTYLIDPKHLTNQSNNQSRHTRNSRHIYDYYIDHIGGLQ